MIKHQAELTVEGRLLTLDPQRDILKPALDSAAEAGLNYAKALTPVDTGFARSQWYIAKFNNANTLMNETSYLPFIDEGTRFIRPRRITPQVNAFMEERLKTEIEKQLREI